MSQDQPNIGVPAEAVRIGRPQPPLVVIDEASDVSPAVWEAIDALEPGRNVVVIQGDPGKSFAVAEQPPEPREVIHRGRRPKRNRPTVAEFVHRHYDGPDPAELPRKRRRMRFPEQWRFHTQARAVRAAL